jgi:hypothetical protein
MVQRWKTDCCFAIMFNISEVQERAVRVLTLQKRTESSQTIRSSLILGFCEQGVDAPGYTKGGTCFIGLTVLHITVYCDQTNINLTNEVHFCSLNKPPNVGVDI